MTLADRQANELICQRLARAFPGVPVVAEESDPASFAGYRTAERAFFVDPLDGTREFVKRNGEFVVMIGLLEAGRPVAGVILAPATGIRWAGRARRERRGRHLRRAHTALRQRHAHARPGARAFDALAPQPGARVRAGALGVRQLDALGSAGLKCAEVAAGTADAYAAPARAGSRWNLRRRRGDHPRRRRQAHRRLGASPSTIAARAW